MAKLQLADDTMEAAVAQTLEALTLGPMDAANALLARKYAQVIDQGDDLAAAMDKYGPKLFACLEVLGAGHLPKAGGGNVPAPGKSKIQKLREARR
jgi:hypothetical protein